MFVNKFKIIIIFSLSFLILVQPLLILNLHAKAQDSGDEFSAPNSDQVNTPNGDEAQFNQEMGATGTSQYDGQTDITADEKADLDNMEAPSAIGLKQFPTDKIILNSVDKRKIEQTEKLSSYIPDFTLEENITELAHLSGVSTAELAGMKATDPAKFFMTATYAKQQIIGKDKANGYLTGRLMNDPVALADIFSTTPEEMSEELQTDRASVEDKLQDAIKTQVDKRVLKTLVYLVTPKDQGGAGHWRITVKRITQGFDKENTKGNTEDDQTHKENQSTASQENSTVEQLRANDTTSSQQLETQLGERSTAVADIVDQNGDRVSTAYIGNKEESDQLVSSHYYGQAVDISEIDDIKCTTVYKQRLGASKKVAQAPRPIKLAWQTSEGYNADKDNLDSSFNNMFLNNSRESLIEMLSQLNFDFENIGDLSSASMSDLLNLVGQAFVLGAVNSPSGNIWKFNLSETLRKLGGVILADNLALDRAAFLDLNVNSIDDLQQAIGRNSAESGLNLPYGALKGTTRDQLLENIGHVKLLNELSLPTDVLNYEIKDSGDLYQRIGSRILEEDLGLAAGSLYGKGSISDVEKAAGKYKLEALLSFGAELDDRFYLPEGTFNRFKSGAISPSDLNRLVTESHFTEFVAIYNNTYHANGSSNAATISLPSGNVSNLRDEVFGLPKGKIDRFFRGELTNSDYKEIGIYSVAFTLENNNDGRTRILNWLNDPNPEYKTTGMVTTLTDPPITEVKEVLLPAQTYAGVLGIQTDDFYRIFGTDQAEGVFSKAGRKLLTEAVKNSDFVQRQTQNLQSQLPWVSESIETYEFYKTRIDNIKKHSTELTRHRNDLQNALNNIGSDLISDQDKRDILFSLAGLVASSGEANPADGEGAMLGLANQIVSDTSDTNSAIANINDIIVRSTNARVKELTNTINAIRYEAEIIAQNAYEIVTGEEQADFRFGQVTVGEIKTNDLNLGNGSFNSSDVALFLAGRVTPKEFLLSMGSAKLADEFDIPKWALKYAAAAVEALTGESESDIKDAFFRAIGVSTLEETSQSNSGTLANVNELGKSISISRLRTLVKDRTKSTQAQADAIIAESLNLKGYILTSLMSGDFAAWSTARAKAEEFDHQNGLATSTTEKFIKGSPLGTYNTSAFSTDDLRRVATKLALSESSIKTFIALRNGQENPAINNIYFVDQNTYQTSNSTNEQCQTQTIAPNSYVYYDKDGLHTFNSYALANEYKKAHADKVLNPVEEIANSLGFLIYREELTGNQTAKTLKANLGDGAAIKNALNSFIADQSKNIAFSEGDYALLKNLLSTSRDLSFADSDKIFSRVGSISGATLSTDDKFDYFKTLGFNVLKKTAANYLNEYVGLDFGSQRITADDVYEIFNGNGFQVFTKIGGSLLDEDLGLQAGTVEGIVSAGSSAERSCLMEQAALNYIGQKYGSNWGNLAGSLLDNLGGGKIDKFFSFPQGSFKGNNLTELLDSVPIEDFARAFQLPYTQEIDEAINYALRKINSETYDDNKDKAFYEKLAIVKSYSQGLGSDGTQLNIDLNEAYQAVRAALKDIALRILSDTNLYGSDEKIASSSLWQKEKFSTYTQDEVLLMYRAFKSRVDTADSGLGLAAGTTGQMLAGAITPNTYRSQVSNNSINSMAGDALANILGLTDNGINGSRVNNFINAIKGGVSGGGSVASDNRATVYSFLSDVFSINLDQKAGFSNGTFASIIKDPQNAWPILLREGAKKLDAQLNLLDANGQPKDLSITNIVSLLTNINPEDKAFCDNVSTDSFTTCINQRRIDAVTDLTKDALINKGAKFISEWLSEITNVSFNITTGDTTHAGSGYGITMPWQDITALFKGDIRPFLVIGMAKAIPSIIGDENGNLAVGNNLVINYQDIYYSIYGNSQIEDYAAQRALDYSYAVYNGSVPIDTNANVDDANQSIFSIPLTTDNTHQSITTMTVAEVNATYPIPDGANTTAPAPVSITDFPTRPNPADYGDNIFAYQDAMTAYNASYKQQSEKIRATAIANSLARTSSREAVANAKKTFRDNFQYALIDCALYKVDKNIPAGFAKAMFSGNGYIRSSAIVNYISNWLINDQGWGSVLSPIALNAIYDYFQSPDAGIRGNTDILIARASDKVFDIVDSYLVGNSPKFLGITLQPGTTMALVNLIRFGNTSSGINIGGKTPTIDSLYGGEWMARKVSAWADKALGMESGSTYKIYESYHNLRQAQKAYDVAKAAKTGIDVASQALKKARLGLYDTAFQMIFSKQIGKFEQAVGLVPGTGGMLITMLFTGFTPLGIAAFVLGNLFGVYKVVVICTADGNYSGKEDKPDATKWDVANLGQFDGMNAKVREQNFIKAAQYKAGNLITDLLTMSIRTGDTNLVPIQIMTGRTEDVIPVSGPQGLVAKVICPKVGASSPSDNAVCGGGSWAGAWANPQTTAWTHIGF